MTKDDMKLEDTYEWNGMPISWRIKSSRYDFIRLWNDWMKIESGIPIVNEQGLLTSLCRSSIKFCEDCGLQTNKHNRSQRKLV